jgi:predicted Rossmann fold flavoprotein
MQSVNKRVAIIGGGAAGMIAAATLTEFSKNLEIHVFEKNIRLGVKVTITGGGRCNVTTGIDDLNILQTKFIRGGEFIKPAMATFPPNKVREWFESKGLRLKEEEGSRVFPFSDNGNDVVMIFEKILEKGNVIIHYREAVESIGWANDFKLISTKNEYKFDFVVITTGGNAYSKTGSSGDGYNFAMNLGHSITPLGPSLNSFEVVEAWCKDLSGLGFQNSEFRVKLNNGKVKVVKGPMLFTHFGITGPAVFALAAEIAFEKFDNKNPLKVQFVPMEGKDFQYWDAKLLETILQNHTKQIDNTLAKLFPQRFCDKIFDITKINPTKKSADVSKYERHKLGHLLSGDLLISLKSRRVGDEFVTAGGVDSSEINRTTMQSRICNGLYFAGEILDVDGLTGGFNLQAAWATGRLAAQSIIRNL